MAKAKAKMGAPKKLVRMDLVEAALQFNATANQVQEVLRSQGEEVSYNTIVREIKRLHGLTFEEYRDKKIDGTRLKLIQKAVKMALDGHCTMLIFCLKNLCNWKDRNDTASEEEPLKEFKLNYARKSKPKEPKK